jgi:regulator of sirC expression with transglutaminase-like and TPR domain
VDSVTLERLFLEIRQVHVEIFGSHAGGDKLVRAQERRMRFESEDAAETEDKAANMI